MRIVFDKHITVDGNCVVDEDIHVALGCDAVDSGGVSKRRRLSRFENLESTGWG